MSHFLFAWELGGQTGHLHHIARVAAEITARGHRVTVATRNLEDAARVLGRLRVALVQAPMHLRPSTLPPSASYAELLFRVGYREAGTLAPLLHAWRTLIGLVAPDVLVAEHAPTALLAGRTLGIPRAMLGTGFMVPRLADPMPSLQPWALLDERRLEEADRTCLAVANGVLAAIGARPLAAVAELFDADARFLCTFPEIDPFAPRADASTGGPLPAAALPASDVPPLGDDAIFAYYSAAFPLFQTLLETLAAIGRPALVVATDAAPELVARTAGQRVQVIARQVPLAAVAGNAALAINYGSPGSASELLLAGRRLVSLPLHVEQYLLTHRLAGQGLARALGFSATLEKLAAVLRAALDDSALAENARAFAARHAGYDPATTLQTVTDRIEALASGQRATKPQSAAPASSAST